MVSNSSLVLVKTRSDIVMPVSLPQTLVAELRGVIHEEHARNSAKMELRRT